MKSIGHLINGEWQSGEGLSQAVFNPSTGAETKQVPLASKATVEQAIGAAKAAFPAWRDTSPLKRASIIRRFMALLEEHKDKIVELIGEEHGKISHDAHGELRRGIENVEYSTYVPELLKGEHSKNVAAGIDSWSQFHALGVVAGITPFNFPAMVPLWMYPMAIACGNTFVLKPSERDPSSVMYIAKLFHQAGLPAGVLNVVNGDKEAVDTLLNDERVMAVSFVGSTAIAKSIYAKATANGKRCQALGGAKNHAIVMPDADMENTVNALIGASFGSSGERCMALSVAVAVGNETAEKLIAGLKRGMQNLQVGKFSDSNNDFGPLITGEHRDKVRDYITSAAEQGAEIVVDGREVKVADCEDGFYIGGTLIDNVSAEMTSYKNEIFGPVLQVVRVDTMQEGMDLIEQHEYGNGACIFTRDGEAGRYFCDNINIGMVGINIPLPVPVASHSFGGWKQSLFGDLAAYGPDSVRFYTRRKTITQRWPSSGIREGVQFAFPS